MQRYIPDNGQKVGEYFKSGNDFVVVQYQSSGDLRQLLNNNYRSIYYSRRELSNWICYEFGIETKDFGVHKSNVVIYVYQDVFNPTKIWCIKVSCGHYYYKQMINAIVSGSYFNGHLVALNDSHNVCNSKWTRTTKRHLIETGVI